MRGFSSCAFLFFYSYKTRKTRNSVALVKLLKTHRKTTLCFWFFWHRKSERKKPEYSTATTPQAGKPSTNPASVPVCRRGLRFDGCETV
jgi:hypothetical protein